MRRTLKPETNASTSETEDDDRMDITPGQGDLFNAMLPPRPPPRVPVQTTASLNNNKASENTNPGFKSSSKPYSPPGLHRKAMQTNDSLSTMDVFSESNAVYSVRNKQKKQTELNLSICQHHLSNFSTRIFNNLKNTNTMMTKYPHFKTYIH